MLASISIALVCGMQVQVVHDAQFLLLYLPISINTLSVFLFFCRIHFEPY